MMMYLSNSVESMPRVEERPMPETVPSISALAAGVLLNLVVFVCGGANVVVMHTSLHMSHTNYYLIKTNLMKILLFDHNFADQLQRSGITSFNDILFGFLPQ